jgi:hypothetical protein
MATHNAANNETALLDKKVAQYSLTPPSHKLID